MDIHQLLHSLAGAALADRLNLVDWPQLEICLCQWLCSPSDSFTDILATRGHLSPSVTSFLAELVPRYLESQRGRVWTAMFARPLSADFLARMASTPAGHELLTQSEIARVDLTPTAHDARSGEETEWCANKTLHKKGGLGVVYRALDLELRREIALKEIQEQYASHPIARKRFLREARITAALPHPNIMPIYRLGYHSDGRPYYTMPFLSGQTLRQQVATFHAESHQRDARSNAQQLQHLIRQLIGAGKAIEFAHQRGIIHRDLKPANIMIDEAGVAVVLDWGLAKRFRVTERESLEEEFFEQESLLETEPLTRLGETSGTLVYMPPEQLQGLASELGPATDVYALGACLYEILTGEFPLEGRTAPEIESRIQSGQIPRPSRRNPACPLPLEAIWNQAMRIRAGDRYPSAKAFVADLENWLENRPVSAHPLSRSRRGAQFLVNHPVPSILGAFALFLVLGQSLSLFSVLRDRSSLRGDTLQLGARVKTLESDTISASEQRSKLERELASARELVSTNEGLLRQERRERETNEEAYTTQIDSLSDRLHDAAIPQAAELLSQNRSTESRDILDRIRMTPEASAPAWEWAYLYAHLNPSSQIAEEIEPTSLIAAERGSSLLYINRNQGLTLWNAGTGARHSRRPPTTAARQVVLFGDDIALRTTDEDIERWRIAGGELRQSEQLVERTPQLDAFSWLDNAKTLVWTERAADGERQLFSTDSEGPIAVPPELAAAALIPSAHWARRQLWLNGSSVFAWNPSDASVSRLLDASSPILDVTVNPLDSDELVTLHEQGIRVASLNGSDQKSDFQMPAGFHPRAIAWSQDGEWFAAGGEHGEVLAWRTNEREIWRVFRGAEERIARLAWLEGSDQARKLAAADLAGTVRVWNVSSCIEDEPDRRFEVEGIVSAHCDEDHITIITSSGNLSRHRLRDASDSRPLLQLALPVSAAAFSTRGDRVAILAHNEVRAVDVESGEVVATCPVDATRIRSLAWLDSELGAEINVAAATIEGIVKIRLADRSEVKLVSNDGCRLVSVHPDANHLAAVDDQGRLIRWVLGQEVPPSPVPSAHKIVALAWHSSQHRLATRNDSGEVNIWSADSPLPLLIIEGAKETGSQLAWTSDGVRLVAIGTRLRAYSANLRPPTTSEPTDSTQ